LLYIVPARNWRHCSQSTVYTLRLVLPLYGSTNKMKRMTFAKQISAAVVFGALAVSSVHAQTATETVTETAQNAVETAQDAVGAITGGWSGSATLGANMTTGNAESSNISAGIRLGKTSHSRLWEHIVFGTLFKGTSTVVIPDTNADGTPVLDDAGQPVRKIVKGDNSDRIALGYEPRYYWRPERTFFFGILDYEQDKPAGIKSGTRQIVGVGHNFYRNNSGFFAAKAGVGNKVTEGVTDDGDSSGAIGYLGLNYLNRLSENVTLNADLNTDLGSDNTAYELGLGLTFTLSENLSLNVSNYTRGNTDLEDLTNPLSTGSDSVTDIKLVFGI